MHSQKFELVKRYYDAGYWNKTTVINAAKFPKSSPWITVEEAVEIFGE